MDYETRQFISQSEANRDEKFHLASAMTIVAVITGLLAAVNSVILFIVNGYLLNYIALTFAILNVLLVVLMIYSFIWNNSQKVYLANTEDDWGEETDNFAGRITFCLCIIMGVLEMVFLVVYLLAQSSILGYYAGSEQGVNIERFEKVLTVTLPFIVILTILIIALIIYQIHGYYQLTISHSTSRFHIFTLSIIAALNTWAVIYILQGLEIYTLSVIINFIVLGVIVIAVISNIWKFKGIFIVLASVQVLLIPVMLGYQGQFIRDYQNLEIDNMQNCQNMMNRVPIDHIESNHCYSKYVIEDCGEDKCYSDSCEKAAMVQMWDIKEHSTKLGCLNRNCCSQTSNLFTQDYLYLVGFSLAATLFLFTLILFEFHLSRMVRGEKTLGRNLEMLFVILFLATCIFGVLLLAQHYDRVPLRQDPQFAQANVVQRAIKFTTTDKFVCKSLTELLTSRVVISSSCQSQANCPINKLADDIKKEQLVVFGIWAKGIYKFVRKEETIYESSPNAKFLFENYDGDNKDFFSILGKHEEIQNYVDDIKLCYEIGQKDLQVHLYQNIAEFAIDSETKQQEISKHLMNTSHKAATTNTNTNTNSNTNTSANNQCLVPNCGTDCKEKTCNQCKDGFKSEQSLGCVFSGSFNKNIDIQVPLYKSIKTKVSGFVYGRYKKAEVGDCRYESKDYNSCRDRTVQTPLANVEVLWDGKGDPIKAKTDAKGSFTFEVSSFNIADFSQAPYQPTGGRLSLSLHGFQDYSVYQMVDFAEEFYLGTMVLASNVAIPKDEEPKTTKREKHIKEVQTPAQATQTLATTTTTTPATTTTTTTTTCSSEEYKDGLKKCQKKLCKSDQKNCLFCDDQNNCLSCENQYQLVQNKDKKLNICQPLNLCDKVQSENNCVKCEQTNNVYKCVECDAFSKLDSATGKCTLEYKTCMTTIENCLLCNKDNKCAICDPGFKLESGLCKNIDFVSAFDINYYSSTITVYDAQDQSPIENAKIKLVFGQCKSDDYYGSGSTDSNGSYTFQKLIKHYQYSVLVSHSEYIDNCYEFRSESQLQVPLSGPLKKGQSRIVLEWDDDKVHPDLFISFNPVENKSCLVGFFNRDCTGAHFGLIANEKIKFQSIFIENLAQVKYLIFVQNFEDKKLYSESYKERLIESKARIKYYIYGSDKPVVTYVAPTDIQDPKIGTNDAYNSEWLAWLVGCVNGSKAEIPHNIVSQNGLWWTNSLYKWYDTIEQKGEENFPNVNICNIEID